MPAILIHQRLDAAGRPAPAEFRRDFPPSLATLVSMQPVFQFLFPLGVSSTTTPNAYGYTDPQQGSGWLEPEGFTSQQLAQIAEYVRMRDLDRRIGMVEPTRWDAKQLAPARYRPTKNPIPMVVLAVFLIVFSLAMIPFAFLLEAGDPTRDDRVIIVTLVIMPVLAVLGGILLWQHARRLRWWFAARAHVKRTGSTMPDDLRISS